MYRGQDVTQECQILGINVYLRTDRAGALQARKDTEEEEAVYVPSSQMRWGYKKIYNKNGHVTYNTDTLEAYDHYRKEFGYYNLNIYS